MYGDLTGKLLVPSLGDAASARRQLIAAQAEARCFFDRGDAAYEHLLAQVRRARLCLGSG